MRSMKNKYNARKATRGGIVFSSKKELKRWQELEEMEKAGEITNLQRQIKFKLLPAQYSKTELTKNGRFKCIERECTYIADFVYKDKQGNIHVEDAKGCKKGGAYNIFVIKRKLMLYMHGIRVEEV